MDKNSRVKKTLIYVILIFEKESDAHGDDIIDNENVTKENPIVNINCQENQSLILIRYTLTEMDHSFLD